MTDFHYGFERKLAGTPYADAVGHVREALRDQGFGVLTEIDVKETFKKKLDVDFRSYVILGACNPVLAKQALESESQIGLLLPCNVVVQDDGEGGSVVSIADPKAMFTLVDNPAVSPVAREAEQKLRRALESLGDEGRART